MTDVRLSDNPTCHQLEMVALRTMPQGHPDYRFIAQEIGRKVQEVHPTLAEVGRFIDGGSYRLGRLQSEVRTEYKARF